MKGPISNAKNANIATPVPTPKNDDNILISAEGPKVSYQFLKQGRPEVKIIIVDPRDITKDRLVVLGNHLRMETQHLSYAHIFVYDNLRAAQLRDELPQRATEADEKEDEGLPHENDSDLMRDFAYSRSHFVAEYTFIKDNRNELEIHPQGTWSSTYRKTIDYSSGHPIESSQ